MTIETPRTWEMLAHDAEDITRITDITQWVQALRMSGVPENEIIRIRLIEDPEGDFRGWLATGEDMLSMVQHKRIFNIQFPYSSEAAVEQGEGVIVPVRVERI